jgi:thioredoxin-related protein
MKSVKLFAAASVVTLFCTVPAFAQGNHVTLDLKAAEPQMDSETMKQILDRDVERAKRIQERTKDVQLKPATKPEMAEKDEPKAEEGQNEHKLPVFTAEQIRRITERDRARAQWMQERIRTGQIELEAEQYIKDHPEEFTPGKTPADWLDDFAAAIEKSKKDKKPILALFTGSDWCPPCQRLEKNVFLQPSFKDFAKKHLVTVFLDFPESAKLDEKVKKQNDELAKKFSVEAYPTLLILSADGQKELWKQVGYDALMLEKIQNAVKELDKDYPETAKAVKDELDAEAKAKAEERAAREKAEMEEFEKQQKEEEAARRNARLRPLGAGRIYRAQHPQQDDASEMNKLEQELDKNGPIKGPDVLPNGGPAPLRPSVKLD